ncbi:MAG TPA: cytochrome c [Rhizomicrobium sp.]|jgi:mono/diheme cytochrome c family protein|nr:cytochrome c [Rhizomicrobium sp.]
MSMMRLFIAAAILPLLVSEAQAQAQDAPGGRGGPFPFQGGQAIFQGVCQGCHMPDAKGAVGAGAYPALAGDAKLATAAYPISIVLHGQKAMPPLGGMLSDKQVADVVTYVRTHFGNKFADKVTPDNVKLQR